MLEIKSSERVDCRGGYARSEAQELQEAHGGRVRSIGASKEGMQTVPPQPTMRVTLR